jgi:Domain of unknown function (DUF2382)
MSDNESLRAPGEGPRQSAAWIDSGSDAADSRIGDSRLVKGGARVVFTEEAPVHEPPKPEGRIIGEAEIAERGLLRERVIEIGEMREEAVVSKQAFVREELVVRKDVEERTERIAETLRRTEVDVERLEPEAADGEVGGDPPGR